MASPPDGLLSASSPVAARVELHRMALNFERAGTQTVKVWVQTPRDVPTGAHQH